MHGLRNVALRQARNFGCATLLLIAARLYAAQVDIVGPTGSVAFGHAVATLPNGNIVITDPYYSTPTSSYIGAIYLYDPAGQRISMLTGSHPNDSVGSGDVLVLKNGNAVVASPLWNSDEQARVGAVTWIDGTAGLSGQVSGQNSLIGVVADDRVGSLPSANPPPAIVELANGDYVVCSPMWTLITGSGGTRTVSGAGAVTWANGSTGASGPVTSNNSFTGAAPDDLVGDRCVTALTNGNYVVQSSGWQQQRGAATWASGGSPLVGTPSVTNSLVGARPGDAIGTTVVALTNGNYVVGSPNWQIDDITAVVGAATWGDGTKATFGVVSGANSLIGAYRQDAIGMHITALTNGNYVVSAPEWNQNRGAVVLGDGNAGTVGAVSTTNALHGVAQDGVGRTIAALSDGNFVVASPFWSAGQNSDDGAITWLSGTTPYVGTISAANSLLGTAADYLGYDGIAALTGGAYVVGSSHWHGSDGAATWIRGDAKALVSVSASNSITAPFSSLAGTAVVALANGNYVVGCANCAGGTFRGAVMLGNGTHGSIGTPTRLNALIGTTDNDSIGTTTYIGTSITPFADGNYAVASPEWHDGNGVKVGAVTLASGAYRLTGPVQAWNSVIGHVANPSARMVYSYGIAHRQLAVGRPAENIVSLFAMDQVFADNFEP